MKTEPPAPFFGPRGSPFAWPECEGPSRKKDIFTKSLKRTSRGPGTMFNRHTRQPKARDRPRRPSKTARFRGGVAPGAGRRGHGEGPSTSPAGAHSGGVAPVAARGAGGALAARPRPAGRTTPRGWRWHMAGWSGLRDETAADGRTGLPCARSAREGSDGPVGAPNGGARAARRAAAI